MMTDKKKKYIWNFDRYTNLKRVMYNFVVGIMINANGMALFHVRFPVDYINNPDCVLLQQLGS